MYQVLRSMLEGLLLVVLLSSISVVNDLIRLSVSLLIIVYTNFNVNVFFACFALFGLNYETLTFGDRER